MKNNLLSRLLGASFLALALVNVRADEEQDLIALIQSSADVPQKCTACQRLRVVGTARSVPALAALLTQERTSHAARYALEGMPYPEVVPALREAMQKTSGSTKAGLIDSLGWRHDAKAVPLLTPLLADADAVVASAAASALGKIGGKQAIAALAQARDKAPPAVLPAVLDSSLRCAELLPDKDRKKAASLYRKLFVPKYSDEVRIAAWRGLIRTDKGNRAALMTSALIGKDRPLHVAALKVLRECSDKELVNACLRKWAELPADSAVAVLDAHVRFGTDALSTARLALQNQDVSVRMAAFQALSRLEDRSAIPVLAKAAARGGKEERAAARDALASMPGASVHEAVLSSLGSAEELEKVELLRALGDRSDVAAADALLQNAAATSESVRVAALESLRKLAVPETLVPLLNMAIKSKSDDECEPVLMALRAICRTSSDKEKTTRSVLQVMEPASELERRWVLPVLAELATPAALDAAQKASRSQNPEVLKKAVLALSEWPNAGASGALLDVARASSDPTLHSLALRGCIGVTELEPDLSKRFAILQQALAAAKNSDGQKQALGRIGQIGTTEALDSVMTHLSDASLTDEAGMAAIMIAEKLAKADPKLARETAKKVLAHCKSPAIVGRAWALRGKGAISGPFIQDWLVSGPYRKDGVTGALAIFDVAFPPEKNGSDVKWKAMPRGEMANLLAIFPDHADCAAYLKAQITAPEDCDAILLLGSDDGVKAWLNGAVVHANNIDRGAKPDSDVAPIQLKKGANELLLKITQGGGGWGAYARIVGTEGTPIEGLRIEPVEGAPAATAPVSKPAALPKRDSFQKIVLSDQFYAEGACSVDLNRDGKPDVVVGPFWFEGPDFQKRHEYRPAKAFDRKGYSDDFFTYAGDFNGDGWPDVLCVGFPGKEAYWYENSAGKEESWKQHLAFSTVANESPAWCDLFGDGHSELLFATEGRVGYAAPDPAHPDQPWTFHAISSKNPKRTGHGMGFGDIDGDKRVDIIDSTGWWEQPGAEPDRKWNFHPFQFAEAGAQILIYDVDGDGLADVITTWHCHAYGLLWWQQVKATQGEITWKKHEILSPTPDVTTTDFRISQMHALDLADINGDGLKDIVTGKRFWAHGPAGDKEPSAPALLLWLELRRGGADNTTFVPHLIDDDSGVGTQVTATDLNADGQPDIIAVNKKGAFLYLNRLSKSSERSASN